MRKTSAMLLFVIAAVIMLVGCSAEGRSVEIDEQEPVIDIGETEEESEYCDTLDNTYELSDLIWFNSETEEWTEADFIPGAERYVFHDDYSCEYICKDYPTYEDMLNDSNYEELTYSGIYIFDPEDEGVSMLFDGIPVPVAGSIDGGQLIMEYEYDDSCAVRSIYSISE